VIICESRNLCRLIFFGETSCDLALLKIRRLVVFVVIGEFVGFLVFWNFHFVELSRLRGPALFYISDQSHGGIRAPQAVR
jgi:hypothetical protein